MRSDFFSNAEPDGFTFFHQLNFKYGVTVRAKVRKLLTFRVNGRCQDKEVIGELRAPTKGNKGFHVLSIERLVDSAKRWTKKKKKSISGTI